MDHNLTIGEAVRLNFGIIDDDHLPVEVIEMTPLRRAVVFFAGAVGGEDIVDSTDDIGGDVLETVLGSDGPRMACACIFLILSKNMYPNLG